MKKMDIARLSPANHRVLRDLNELMVLNVIREKQPISRIEIAGLIGLEGSTVSKIVSRLLDHQLIYEAGVAAASPQGGRKKRFLHLNPQKAYALGVELRHSGYTVVVSDFTGRILRSVELPPSADPRQALQAVARQIKRLLREFSREKVEGIGVSLMGLVEPSEGRALAGEGLGWGEDVPVGALLREALQMDLPLYFENDAWLGALAELWFGRHVRRPRDLVFLSIDEGIGSGIIIQGQLYHGFLHGAGEFGHIPLHPEGPPCSCGSRGCLETYAADPVTVRRYLKLCCERSPSADHSEGTSIEDVVTRALAGVPEAAEALQETARHLGRGLVPVVYSLNPEMIVLAGPITRAWRLILPTMRRELAKRASRFYLDRLSIIPTTLDMRPSLVGSVALVLARSFSAPSLVSLGDHG